MRVLGSSQWQKFVSTYAGVIKCNSLLGTVSNVGSNPNRNIQIVNCFNHIKMAKFKISGVWKDSNNVITHYAFHTVDENSVSRAIKQSKAHAIELLEIPGNTAITWIWNYRLSKWDNGEDVQVVSNFNGKYLRSNPDNRLTDNLGHLIDYDWIVV